MQRSKGLGPWNRLLLGAALGALLLAAGMTLSGTASAGPSSPQVVLTPSTGLVDRQEITVSGTGFPASVQVAVIQCRNGPAGETGCDISTLRYAGVAADGSFSTPFAVRQALVTGSGPVDCSTPNVCQVGAGVTPVGSPFANTPLEVAAFVPPSIPPGTEPTCASPYAAVGYFLGAVGVPELPPGVTGDVRPYPEVGATVAVVPDGGALLLTVTLDGITRQFTTAPHALGGDYNRTPGASDTGYGKVSIVYNPSGAVYVVLAQNNSGAYTRIGWRFDDPCVGVAAAVASDPTFTG
jgi:hypothetical protein